MRLLLVGSQMHWAIERHYLTVLRQELEALEVFPAPDLFAQYYQGWSHKIAFRLGLAPIYRQINRDLLDRVAVFKPDVIWIWKGMEIFPQTLHFLRQQGIKLVNYNPDHPFILSSRGSGNQNVTNSVGLYDLHFCYHQQLAKKIEAEYKIPTANLPFGYHYADEALQLAQQSAEIPALAFIGNPDPTRVTILQELTKAGLPIDIYGHFWERHLNPSHRLKLYGPVFGNEFWVKMRQYRVQLNIFRPHNIGSHNMRSFEIPGIGGIMLAPDSPEHRSYFQPDSEIFVYNSVKEVRDQAQMLLAMSASDAQTVRGNALNRSQESKYSYSARAQQAVQVLNQL